MAKILGKIMLGLSILALILTIIGILIDFPILQKTLFLVGATFLFLSAVHNKQRLFASLELIVIIGILLNIFNTPSLFLYAALMTISIVTSISLYKIISKARHTIIGSIGLLILAFGMATDICQYPTIFYLLTTVGSIFMATYSILEYYYFRKPLSIIFAALNLLFIIKPLIILWQIDF